MPRFDRSAFTLAELITLREALAEYCVRLRQNPETQVVTSEAQALAEKSANWRQHYLAAQALKAEIAALIR